LSEKIRRKISGRAVTGLPLSLFFTDLLLVFIWYGIVCQVPLAYTSSFVQNMFLNLSNFWSLESRPTYALELVGLRPREGVPNVFGFWLGTIIRGAILVGLCIFFLRIEIRKHFKIKSEYGLIGSVAVITLASFIVLPHIASLYNLDRLYLTLLVFLLPFMVVGIYFLSPSNRRLKLPKEKVFKIILTFLIIAQMLYGTGLVHQLAGYPSYVVLNTFESASSFGELSPDSRYYVFDQDVDAVRWITTYATMPKHPPIIADHIGKLLMNGYGLIPKDYGTVLSNDSSYYLNVTGSYFFLRGENILCNRIFSYGYVSIPYVFSNLSNQNIIYEAGVSRIYIVTRYHK